MVNKNTYLSNEEHDIVKVYSKKWDINEEETIKKIIKDFKEDN